MNRKYKHLSSPIRLGNQIFRNRMFSAPMGGTDITKDCTVGPKSTAFYEYRARGGAASVTVSELVVHPETEHSHMYHLDLESPDSLASFYYTADAIRRHGAVASVELSHSGQFAGTYLTDKKKKGEIVQWGPSEGTRPDGRKVSGLAIPQIQDIVRAYGEKAALAKKAGFQMVMIHAGHGWLINQFLSPFFNSRDDEYGGSVENRCRFLLEVLDSVREEVGPGFPVELRMSGSELFDGGYTLDDGVEIAKLAQSRVDLIHVSAGSYQKGFGITHPSMFVDHGVNVHMAARIKENVEVPVATVGGLNDPEMMEEIIASGKADVVEMARALLADPELPRKVVTNHEKYIRHCLRCFVCMAERAETSTRRCAVNPCIGREMDGTEIVPARLGKRVLVVGAGPAGLQAAYTAARRGHKVILCDRNDEVGGVLVGEKAIPFKYEMYKLGVTLGEMARQEGVEIRLNTTVDSDYAQSVDADVIIAATGSRPFAPPIPGIDGNHVIPVTDYHHSEDSVGDRVVVMGGGLSGCEMAVHLAREGKEAVIVEMRDALCPDANIRHRPLLLQEIKNRGIEIYASHKIQSITKEGVTVEDEKGRAFEIPGDTVISALGQRPATEAAMELFDCAPLVHMIGDCLGVSNITNAVYTGHHIALDI